MDRVAVITALAGAGYFRGHWTLNDRLYSPVSLGFALDARKEWLESLPTELAVMRQIGGGKSERDLRYIDEVWNCNNSARDFGGFLTRCMAVDAVKTGRKHGNLAGGKFDFFLTPGNLESGHTINWFLDHDGRPHHLDVASGQVDHLTLEQLGTIFGGEST